MKAPPPRDEAPPGEGASSHEIAAAATAPPLVLPIVPDEVERALDIARDLARAGVPIFLAGPDGAGGFRFPGRWQFTRPDAAALDGWRPGMAVCAVMGVVCDGLDVDPCHGGDASASGLRAASSFPRSYGRALTPSGGWHDLIPRLRTGSRDAALPGVDIKGGRDGRIAEAGRGFLFIAPTDRICTASGEPLPPYQWEVEPDLDGIEEGEGSAEVEQLADIVREALARRATSTTSTPSTLAPERAALDAEQQGRVGRYIAAAVAGVVAELRAAQAWPEGEVDADKRGWERQAADAAWRLGRLARASWNALTVEDARRAFVDAAPTCATWTARDVARKWAEQHERGEPAAWPSALDEPAPGGLLSTPAPLATPTSPPATDEVTPGGVSFTDAYLADRVGREVLAGRYCWSGALGWMRWDGRRWAPVEEAAVIEEVRRFFIRLHSWGARKGLPMEALKALTGLLARGRIGAVVSLARGVVLVDAASFDAHPDLLNVGNGVIDLRTGTLGPHDPELRLTRITTVDYNPDASSPDWAAALESLPADVRPWWRVRIGQAATGHAPPDDVMPVSQGGGSNGKTLMMGAIQCALGEHAVLVSDRVLLANPDAHPTELMDLRGARFALIEETPEARRLSVSRLKKTVGTPLISARYIRRDGVVFAATHSLFLTSNYRPQVEEVDDGTWRRLALVRFPITYRAPGEPLRSELDRHGDPGLRERLKVTSAAQQAVLAWIVEGARQWYAADRVMPPIPARVAADTLAWRAEADHVLGYLTERLVLDRDRYVMGTDLLADFNDWAESRGMQKWGNQTLSERFGGHGHITSAGVEQRRLSPGAGLSRVPAGFLSAGVGPARFRGWLGVRFRTPADDAAEDLRGPVDGVDGVSRKEPRVVQPEFQRGTPSTPSIEAMGADRDPF